MNLKKYIFTILLSSITFSSCKNGNTINSEHNYDDYDFKYEWNLSKNSSYNKTLDIYTSSITANGEPLTLKVNNQEFTEEKNTNFSLSFNFEGIDIKSDNSYNAADYFYLNNNRLGKIPSDGNKGVIIDETAMINGNNVVTITIGRLWSDLEYDPNLPHGNQYQSCDDYQIKNFHLSLPTNKIIYPDTMIIYIPEKVGVPANQAQVVIEKEYDPQQTYWVGDGWSGNDTYYNHSNPRFNIPYKIDFVFKNYQKPTFNKFSIDTTKFADEYYEVSLFEGDNIVQHSNIYFDNTLPNINVNITNYATLNKYTDKILVSFEDITSKVANSYVLIDGNVALKNSSLDNLENGWHYLTLFAIDNAGNYDFKNLNFYVAEVGKFKVDYNINSTEIILTANSNFSASDFYTTKYNTTSYTYNDLEIKVNSTLPIISNEKESVPYHYFETQVTNRDQDLLLTYSGESLKYERFAIKAYNVLTKKYDTVAVGYGNENITIQLDHLKYVDINNIFKAYVTLDLVDNKSNSIIWISDSQHYTKFDDLNKNYEAIMNYSIEQYKNNNAGYLIHTGDLVEDFISSSSNEEQYELVYNQWEIANNAHKILDEAKMPYGVVSGNHDTGTSLQSLNYEQFKEFFGNYRFHNTPWFGGSLNDNESHYDLITIGNIDFIVMYLGYGVEANLDTINWANTILKRYPNRNAILCTHSYLKYNGGNGLPDETSRYDSIFNNIVSPNENVIMVLCGHDNGAYRRSVKIDENRYVYEILADYQFVDENPNDHLIGTYPGCNGEGYLRIMTFEDKKMSNITYSPVKDKYNPFGNDKDEFTIDLKDILVENNRYLKTTNFEVFSVSDINNTITSTDNKVTFNISSSTLIIKVYDNYNNVNYIIINN